jgi:hypothetical protein
MTVEEIIPIEIDETPAAIRVTQAETRPAARQVAETIRSKKKTTPDLHHRERDIPLYQYGCHLHRPRNSPISGLPFGRRKTE